MRTEASEAQVRGHVRREASDIKDPKRPRKKNKKVKLQGPLPAWLLLSIRELFKFLFASCKCWTVPWNPGK